MKKLRKAFFCFGIMILLLYVVLRKFNRNFSKQMRLNIIQQSMADKVFNAENKNNINSKLNLKYILHWTLPRKKPSLDMGEGQISFIERNCPFYNCFVTTNRSYLGDYTKFDVITFEGSEGNLDFDSMPNRRSLHQKFVFISKESSDNYPICSNKFNHFFNWTWTYRLDSDATWTYIVVKDSKNQVIGPKQNMTWIKLKNMKPLSKDIKDKLQLKTRAAAWFVSNCDARSSRSKFVEKLRAELNKLDLEVDIYGDCGSNNSCPREDQEECNRIIEADYFFYLSFENSFAEDYVTEKLLYPLQNLAVPIVFGSANYTRFMMDGIYINALELGPRRLAMKMYNLISNSELYEDYFKWINYYSYHNRSESIETDDICTICSMLNDEEMVKKTTVYGDFRKWWDPPKRCEVVISLINDTVA